MFNPAGILPAQVNVILGAMQAQMTSRTPANDQTIHGGRLTLAGILTPSGPNVTVQGTPGATTYSYKVVATFGNGHSAASPVGTTVTGNATLSATNSNLLAWAAVQYATGYTIYRTAGGATQGAIGTTAALAMVDTGFTADGTTAPTLNTTGSLLTPLTLLTGSTDAVPGVGKYAVTTAGVDAMTLNAPSAADDGLTIEITDIGGHAHTVTTGTNGFNGASHVATFSGTAQACLRLTAKNSIWYLTGCVGITLS